MAIALVGTTVTNALHANANSFNVNAPGTLASSDVVIIFIRHTAISPAFACTGFTNHYEGYDNSNGFSGIAILIGTGFTGTPTFTVTSSLTASDQVAEACFAYSGANTTPIIGTGYTANGGGSNFNVPGITFAGTNGRAVMCLQQQFIAAPRTVTPTLSTVAAWNTSCYVGDATIASSGATGSFTVSNTNFNSVAAIMIGLDEAVSFFPSPRWDYRSSILRR